MDYIRIIRKLGVKARVKDGVLDQNNDVYTYADIVLKPGEPGPLPTEQEVIDKHNELMAKKAEKDAHRQEARAMSLDEYKIKLMAGEANKFQVQGAMKKLIDRVEYLEAKLKKKGM